MFNLLVTYSGWTPPKGTIPKGRFLTQTHQHVLDQLSSNGMFDLSYISRLKTLFMPEIGSRDAEPFGRVGALHNIRDIGTEYAFEFHYDTTIPPIPIEHIEEMSAEFGVVGFGLSNTHWSVKDSDLFELLYRRVTSKPVDGHAFKIKNLPVKHDQIALMMPFDIKFNSVRDAIFSLASSINCRCLRADNVWREDVLIQDVIDLIVESKVVICDATGRNPNVFYEAGIAHALGKRVIVIAQNADDIPFDLRHLRYVPYLGNKQGIEKLVSDLLGRVKELINA